MVGVASTFSSFYEPVKHVYKALFSVAVGNVPVEESDGIPSVRRS